MTRSVGGDSVHSLSGRPRGQADAPVLMAVAQVSLGWPLTILAVALTLAAVRRAVRTSTGTSDVSTQI